MTDEKEISLPLELRDGGVLDFGREHALGWYWGGDGGVLHLLRGVTLEEAQTGGWSFNGQIVDADGNVLQEAFFDCPRCGRRSYHPKDVEHGYCGHCHDWTGDDE